MFNPILQTFSPMFSPGIFIILTHTFKTNLEFVFVNSVRQGSNVILLHMDIQLPKHHLLKRPFFPTNIFATLVENELTIKCKGLILESQFYSINLCVYLQYASTTLFLVLELCIKFEIRNCEFFNFVLLLQNCFRYSGSLAFPHEFLDQFVHFCKKNLAGILIGIVLNMQISLWNPAI